MTRRELLTAVPGAAALAQTPRTSAPRPPEAPAPYPGAAYHAYSRCLPDYLRRLALRSREIRNKEIANLTTPGAIRARQQWARETFWNLVGGTAERTPLNARRMGSFERPGYRVERIVLESRPGFHVAANLYIPSSAEPPFPAILFQMGHSANGKAYGPYQRCCQGLARLGFMVLAFDPMGQGERVYYPNSTGTATRLRSSDDEHTTAGRQMLLYGDTVTRMQVWDAMRCLDYLAAHPMADPKRLGSTGQSGGATVTMLLACVDDRLAAAVECSGNTENFICADFNPPGSTDDAEQNFVGGGPAGFDRWDLLYPMAPKPLLLTVSDHDFFGTYSPNYIRDGWAEYAKLKRVYEVLGQGDRLGWDTTPLPHGLGYDSRLHVYSWFSRWLKGETAPIAKEPPTEPERDQVLWVSEAGNLVRAFNGKTPFLLNRDRAVKRTPADLAPLIGADKPAAGLKFTILKRVPSMQADIEAVEVGSAPGVWLPGWVYLPRAKDASRPVLLLLEPLGHTHGVGEGGLYETLAAKGATVCAAALRGIGDMAPEAGRGNPNYVRGHSDEEHYAWASMMLGKPLAGQRTTDILALAAALRAHPAAAGRELVLAASGTMAVPALFAAALDPKISRVYLSGGLASFRNLVESENYNQPFGSFVPGILLHTDLPEIVAGMAPRPVILAGPVDAMGRTLEAGAAAKIYSANNVKLLPKPAWDAEALLG